MIDDLISRRALYEKTAEWEAQALHMVEKTMNDEDLTEWRKWSIILKERSAFKFDIADAPSAQPQVCDNAISREDAKWVVFCNRDHVEDQANAIDSLPCVLPSAQSEPERKNESVGCNGCRYDWFGDPRCAKCARSFEDHYEAEMKEG